MPHYAWEHITIRVDSIYIHSIKAIDYLLEMLKHCIARTLYIHVTLKEAEAYLCFLSLTYPKTQLYIFSNDTSPKL